MCAGRTSLKFAEASTGLVVIVALEVADSEGRIISH